jgi:hypothetical protein
MRKILTAALAALTVGGAVAATTTPADAAPFYGHGGYYGHGYGYGRGYGPGLAVGAGLLGLAVGASLAGPHYYGPPPAYYAGPAYYGYYGGCRVHYRWDPYAGRYFPVERCY